MIASAIDVVLSRAAGRLRCSQEARTVRAGGGQQPEGGGPLTARMIERTSSAVHVYLLRKNQCKILTRNELAQKFRVILSSDSDFHRTVKIRIEYPESRVLNSDPRSWILDQASTWALLAGFSNLQTRRALDTRRAPRA